MAARRGSTGFDTVRNGGLLRQLRRETGGAAIMAQKDARRHQVQGPGLAGMEPEQIAVRLQQGLTVRQDHPPAFIPVPSGQKPGPRPGAGHRHDRAASPRKPSGGRRRAGCGHSWDRPVQQGAPQGAGETRDLGRSPERFNTGAPVTGQSVRDVPGWRSPNPAHSRSGRAGPVRRGVRREPGRCAGAGV